MTIATFSLIVNFTMFSSEGEAASEMLKVSASSIKESSTAKSNAQH